MAITTAQAKYQKSAKGKNTRSQWKKSPKGKAAAAKWSASKKGKALQARWKKSVRGKTTRRASAARRRARIFLTEIGEYSAITKIYSRAQQLKQWFDVVVDHIVPLAKGGTHKPSNLQIIYRIENLQKSARLDYTPTVVFT